MIVYHKKRKLPKKMLQAILIVRIKNINHDTIEYIILGGD